MVHVTLVGEKQATKNSIFVYHGPLRECRECKYKLVCFNLVEGKRYIIRALREARHSCGVHEGGVRAVEVEVHPFEATVEVKHANEGALMVYEPPGCTNLECGHYRLCHPPGVRQGHKFTVNKVWEEITCPEEKKMFRVVLG